MFFAAVFGDIIANLANQCRPYELFHGDTDEVVSVYTEKIANSIKTDKFFFAKAKKAFYTIAEAFSKIPMERTEKIKVGVVGEIFVKYSPLGNNNLEKFLLSEGAEVVCPGLLDFCLYSVYSSISDYKLYGMKKGRQIAMRAVYKALGKMQNTLIETLRQFEMFDTPTDFEHIKALASEYICTGAQMGEGWLLPAEMLELCEKGVNNIVCTQPFGCLPNHIFGKGMMKPLKDKNPEINIVAIDYDPGATKVNQENRIKLMLSSARASMKNTPKNVVSEEKTVNLV